MALPETERVVINPSNSNSSSPLERGVPGIESKAIKTLVMSRNKRGWRRASGQSLVPAPTNKDGIWRDIDENVTFPFWLCTPVVHTSGVASVVLWLLQFEATLFWDFWTQHPRTFVSLFCHWAVWSPGCLTCNNVWWTMWGSLGSFASPQTLSHSALLFLSPNKGWLRCLCCF